MKWKRSLFGYRESEVNEYVRNLSEVLNEASGTYREKIRVAEAARLQQEMVLESLRREVDARHTRLEEVESRLAVMYYRVIHMKIDTDPNQAENGTKTAGCDSSRWEKTTMNKQKVLHTSFLGVAPKDLAEHLISQEKNHEELINSLSEKLGKLEEAIAVQNEEIRKLEELLAKPDMQGPFIDMAEHFLAHFELILLETVKRTMKPVRGRDERDTAIPGGDDERFKERELIMRIARNRRKIKTLLRTMGHRQDGAGATDAVEIDESGTVSSAMGAGAVVAAETQAEAAAKTEAKPWAVKSANIVLADGIAADADSADNGSSVADDVSADIGYAKANGEASAAVSAAYDAAAGAAAIIGINAAFTAAIKAASIAGDDDTDSTEADSTEADSTKADSTEADSTKADSTKADSTKADSMETDSTEVDSMETDSTEADSTETGNADIGRDDGVKGRNLRLLYLFDKRAGEDLVDEHGEILIRKGGSIHPDIAEEIDKRGLVDRLVRRLVPDTP